MTNPFKKIAPALLLRGALFTLLGLLLLTQALPALINVQLSLDLSAALFGAGLLAFGVVDIVHGMKRLTRIRVEKLESRPIDFAYAPGAGGERLPPTLMSADENPNEAAQATLIEWLARVMPRLAYLPLPYTGALHSTLIAFGLGVLGLAIYVLLRVLMAGPMGDAQLANMLDWYLFLYFLLGFAFWAGISRYGFRRALIFEARLMPTRIVTLFLALLLAAVVAAIALSRAETPLVAPPSLGPLVPLLWGGSLLVVLGAVTLVMLRARRAPNAYSVHRGEEFFTVGMHPSDIINIIKSCTGKIGAGAYMHMGNWKPDYKEHTAVHAGEFEANLNAESAIRLNEAPSAHPEARLGTAFAWLGVLLTAAAGVWLWQASGTSWSNTGEMLLMLRTPIALLIFGVLIYRLGIIPVAELEWTSVLTNCRMEGTFQSQGGMALVNNGSNSLKGSVLTSATVQPRCAFLTSVGFLQPGLAKNSVVRLIDRVEPADSVANDLLGAIHAQAARVHSAGSPVAPAAPVGEALPDPAQAGDGAGRANGPEPAA